MQNEATQLLDLRHYLNGTLEGAGVVINWRGESTDSFVVKIRASWQGSLGKIEEEYTYSDGRAERRILIIDYYRDDAFTATADDILGRAKGRTNTKQLSMQYTQKLKSKSRTLTLRMFDKRYLLNEQVMIVKIRMRKWGVNVGEILMTLRKIPEAYNAE
jgi:hypothetical protein